MLFGRMCGGCCVSYVFCVHFRGKIVIYCWVSHNILVANPYGHQLQKLDVLRYVQIFPTTIVLWMMVW